MKTPTLSQIPMSTYQIEDPLDLIDPLALSAAIDSLQPGPLLPRELPEIVSRENLLAALEESIRILLKIERTALTESERVQLAALRNTLALAQPGRFNR